MFPTSSLCTCARFLPLPRPNQPLTVFSSVLVEQRERGEKGREKREENTDDGLSLVPSSFLVPISFPFSPALRAVLGLFATIRLRARRRDERAREGVDMSFVKGRENSKMRKEKRERRSKRKRVRSSHFLDSLSPSGPLQSIQTMNALALRSPLSVAPRRSCVIARAAEGAQINKTVDKASPKVIDSWSWLFFPSLVFFSQRAIAVRLARGSKICVQPFRFLFVREAKKRPLDASDIKIKSSGALLRALRAKNAADLSTRCLFDVFRRPSFNPDN